MEPNTIYCPKCNSTQLHFAKKGFSGKKAVIGGILTGGLGLFAGTIGSNKILANCMSCGNQFSPSELKPTLFTIPSKNDSFPQNPRIKSQRRAFMIFFLVVTLLLIYKFISSIIESGFSASLLFLLIFIYATLATARFTYKSLY